MIETILSAIQTLFSFSSREDRKRGRTIETTRLIGVELENLADLFTFVLEASEPNGKIKLEKINELCALRIRNWNRWGSILDSGAYQLLTIANRQEIETAIKIAHAAPGDYIDELFMIQKAESECEISLEIRAQFSGSIAKLRDVAAKLRLTA